MSKYTAEWNYGKRSYDLYSQMIMDFSWMFHGMGPVKQKGRYVGFRTTAMEGGWLMITCEDEESAKSVAAKIAPKESKGALRMVNRDIRILLATERITQSQLAGKMKLGYSTMTRLMVKELTPEEHDKVLTAIEEISRERTESHSERTITAIMRREGISRKDLCEQLNLTEGELRYMRHQSAKRPVLINAILAIIARRTATDPKDPLERTQHWGISIYEICIRLGIGQGTYYRWCTDGHQDEIHKIINDVLEYRRRYRVYD